MAANQKNKIEAAPVKGVSADGDRKLRARKQGSGHPCGAHIASDLEFGTRQYFDAIENDRYQVYAPWMPGSIEFERFRGKRVLEVGCGTGTDLLQFARNGARVTGVDFTPRSVEITRHRFDVYGFDGEFSIGDAENLSFPDESFDVYYSFGVLHHTPDTERAVAEAHRVLCKGGRAIVMLYHRTSLYYWGGIILKHGVIHGGLLRETASELMSRYVEYPRTDARPLVKAYTRAEARRLFRAFSDIQIEVNQLRRAELGIAGRMIPENIFQRLARAFGWNLLVTATK